MTVEDMHYDFKMKLNKIDSNQYRNLKIPEIDWVLNEAQEIFIKLVANPRLFNGRGFETNQRSIDDIRNIVVIDLPIFNNGNDVITLPSNYWQFIRGRIIGKNNECGIKSCVLKIQQQDDEFEESEFNKSSFYWGEINGIFFENGIKIFKDSMDDFYLNLSYLRRPAYIHFAAGFPGGQYRLPNNTLLIGTQDCELSFQSHTEIVDIAVALASGNIQAPDYQIKFSKLNLNQLI